MSWWYCPVCGGHFPSRHRHSELTTEENVGLTTDKYRTETHYYGIPDGPKMLKEALCLAQGLLLRAVASTEKEQYQSYADILGHLINECDRKRPIGSNGKHGDLHTAECGCDDAAILRKKCPQDRRHYLDAHAPGGAWYGVGHNGEPSPWPVKGNDEQQTT